MSLNYTVTLLKIIEVIRLIIFLILIVPCGTLFLFYCFMVRLYRKISVNYDPDVGCCDNIPVRCKGCPYRPENREQFNKIKQRKQAKRNVTKN